jgi:hypothetical protein
MLLAQLPAAASSQFIRGRERERPPLVRDEPTEHGGTMAGESAFDCAIDARIIGITKHFRSGLVNYSSV